MMSEKDKPVFAASAPPREKRITLEWPLEYDGKVYDAITLRRLTVTEVSAFVETLKGDAKFRLPIFHDDTGAPVPEAVMDSLDDDDAEALDRAMLDFLPRRFRAPPEAQKTESAPSTGEAAAPSSKG
jgi:hypothetical protein